MRRVLVIPLIVGVIVAAAILLTARSGGESPYRVAVVFDSAKGMTTNQLVKIAGARVGKVEDIRLLPGPKARMVLSVKHGFGPFHRDARCEILPEGLISENFVQCDPGSRGQPALSAGDDGLPTVPVTRTQVPVSLQDVLNIFSLPTDQRIRALVTELGIGTASRGADLNALIRRANPALSQAQRVLEVVNGQRRELTDAVSQTDLVLGQVASRTASVRAFVDRTAQVTDTTAAHRVALGDGVRRLPTMLDAVRPGLRSLDDAMTSGTPLLDALDASAPGLRTLTTTLPAFARAGTPALKALGTAARNGRLTVPPLQPVVKDLRTASMGVIPFAKNLDDFLVHFRDHGGSELVLQTLYSLATSTAAYDNVSHIITTLDQPVAQCIAGGPTVPGCSHAYTAPDNGRVPVSLGVGTGTGTTTPSASRRPRTSRRKTTPPAAAAPTPATPDAPATPQAPAAKAPTPAAPASPLPDVGGLLKGLLGGSPAPPAPSGPTGPAPPQDPLSSLLGGLMP